MKNSKPGLRAPWPSSVSRPVVSPLMPSVVYASADPDELDAQYDGRIKGYTYAREGHPNAEVLAGLIDRLEKQDLVTRERCTEDRRVIYIEITKKALDLLKKMDEPVMDLHQQLIGHLSHTELKELSRLLEKARLSLTEED